MHDIIYKDDKYQIWISQEFKTRKNRNNIFTKEIYVYLDSVLTTSYLCVQLNYDKNNKAIFTFFEYDDYLPKDMNCLRYQLKYNPLCVKRLYDYLFNDIKNKNYMREKSE